ncbi:ACT domain-containing protein [Lactobacillus helveticus]|uniref:ACT domain-containing protein n=1 Tax=Lactobacillus helveticus TaxID=1587 RepID=UPI0021825A6E|nr:ACT domain-containing protein [Lactobacillus helveticus]MCT0197702.1 ACT domain-containing protein [Lactobacillus helveticus]
MKAVITVIGHDQIGIVAKVSQRLATLKVNITDISQTLMSGDFTMMLMGEWNDDDVQFEVVKQGLQDLANETGLSINIQRQELFDAIQKL